MSSSNRSTRMGTAFDTFGDEDLPAIVLIHGLGLNRHVTWSGLLPALVAQYHVIAYDLVGHGDSVAPTGDPTLGVFSKQLLELLDSLSIEQASLVGFSLGGMINRRFAIDHANRTSCLAILNSPHERGAEQQRLVEERARTADAGGIKASLETTIARWFTPDFLSRKPSIVREVQEGLLTIDPASYAACRWTLATGVTELIRPEHPIRTPSLVMTCENDSGSTPAMSQAIANEIDGSEMLVVPSLQHMGIVERPDAFASPLLDFLERNA